MNAGEVIFAPLLPWPVLGGAATFLAVLLGYALWRGQAGWWLRALAAAVVFVALANPSLQRESRDALNDVVLLLVDRTSSQGLSDRTDQTEAAIATARARIAARPGLELKVIELQDDPEDGGTLLMGRLAQALSEVPRDRVAGAILLSDGQVHDAARAPDLPAPMQLLLTGRRGDWDRRLVVKSAPAFAILGEPVRLVLRIEDQGAVPPDAGDTATLNIALDGGEAQAYRVPVGQDVEFPLTLDHGGMNVVQFQLPAAPGELTDSNNSAVVQINGVRDRLRVLLVSGKPHAGGRTWRNLLKSDSAVDLVHFTILRPPDKQDNVPVSELSLIAFPTRELFLDKIDQFDLIIFDRYERRGILPSLYLENVVRYVRDGGAVLVAAGPAFASADSLYRSPLGAILPAAPTSRVIEGGYKPRVTDLGDRHPVTEGLEALSEAGATPDGNPGWGRWFRLIELDARSGETVMSGQDDKPLLVLDRVGEGRVALLGSDHAWLWSRGFEGGGPQAELLRRLAHWMMKEPELEEEALLATAEGQTMTVTRRTLGEGPRELQITGPDGARTVLPMEEVSPGRFRVVWDAPEIGLYRLSQGDQEAVVALGPSAPREFEETIATGDKLAAAVKATRGGVMRLEDGFPDIRLVRQGRVAAGRGWIGLTPRGAYVTRDVTVVSLVPAWLFLLLAGLLSLAAWLREGRR